MGDGVRTNPSSNPSPVVAQLGTTNQILSFSVESLSASVTSCGFIAIILLASNILIPSCAVMAKNQLYKPPGISCLFAKTKSRDSFISLSLIIRCSSCRASSIRTLSEESMTKIRP